MEDPRNFEDAAQVITMIRTGENIAAWDLVSAANDAFSSPTMCQRDHPSLEDMQGKYKARTPVLVHASLYRALKLHFPTDVAGVITPGAFTAEMGSCNLGEAGGELTSDHFRPSCSTH